MTVTVDGGSGSLGAAGAELSGTPLPHDFPDWRGVARDRRAPGVAVDGALLRRALQAAPIRTVRDRQVAVLTADGAVTGVPGTGCVGVDREFLLQALDAGGPGLLAFELDGSLRPLALRRAGGTAFSLLMPVRL